MVIYKIRLLPVFNEIFQVRMQRFSQILSCQMQGGYPVVWFLCYDQEVLIKRRFILQGTGLSLDFGNARFIDTIQDGPFVWHLFDLGEANPHEH